MYPIYLDFNATTPCLPEVIDAMVGVWRNHWGNASSSHLMGLRAKACLEEARMRVSSLMNASSDELIFTSGGTESNNTVLFNLLGLSASMGRHLIVSEIEHPSVLNAAIRLMEQGVSVDFARVNSAGVVTCEEIQRLLRPNTALVSVMLANNETGVMQPVSEIARLVKPRGILVHTDAAQALGKIPVNVRELQVDYLTLAGHKLYAPKGIGALFVAKDAPFTPFLLGGGQEKGRRAGTEAVALAAGLGRACELLSKDIDREMKRQEALKERLWQGLQQIWPHLRRHGQGQATLPNTLSVSFVGVNATGLLARCEKEFCASTGAACHDRSVRISHVLAAMGVGQEVAQGTVRFSLGRTTTEDQIDAVLSILGQQLKEVSN
jgi:cysteine desulfurase